MDGLDCAAVLVLKVLQPVLAVSSSGCSSSTRLHASLDFLLLPLALSFIFDSNKSKTLFGFCFPFVALPWFAPPDFLIWTGLIPSSVSNKHNTLCLLATIWSIAQKWTSIPRLCLRALLFGGSHPCRSVILSSRKSQRVVSKQSTPLKQVHDWRLKRQEQVMNVRKTIVSQAKQPSNRCLLWKPLLSHCQTHVCVRACACFLITSSYESNMDEESNPFLDSQDLGLRFTGAPTPLM